jgi:FKBP-type peptidyl-prolyl cis-trans isomerase 2
MTQENESKQAAHDNQDHDSKVLAHHDFIELDYTGRLKENNAIFDTTYESIAKASGLAQPGRKFSKVIVCLGESHILKSIEEFLIGKKIGDYTIGLTAEKAFGKKDAKLLRLIPMKIFIKEKINPFAGLEVNIDNKYGIIRTVSGGRVIVDFNNPLSGRDVIYDVKISRVVVDPVEKVKALLRNELNIADLHLEFNEGNLILDEKMPKEVVIALEKRIKDLVPEVKSVSVKEKKDAASEKKE